MEAVFFYIFLKFIIQRRKLYDLRKKIFGITAGFLRAVEPLNRCICKGERAQALEAENRSLKNENQELKDKLRSFEKLDSRLQFPDAQHNGRIEWDFEE